MITREVAFTDWMEAEFQCKRWQGRVALATKHNRRWAAGAALASSGAMVALVLLADKPILRAVVALAGVACSLAQTHLLTKDDIIEMSGVYGEWIAICSAWERIYLAIENGESVERDELVRLRERRDAAQRRAAPFAHETKRDLEKIQRDVAQAHGLELPT